MLLPCSRLPEERRKGQVPYAAQRRSQLVAAAPGEARRQGVREGKGRAHQASNHPIQPPHPSLKRPFPPRAQHLMVVKVATSLSTSETTWSRHWVLVMGRGALQVMSGRSYLQGGFGGLGF